MAVTKKSATTKKATAKPVAKKATAKPVAKKKQATTTVSTDVISKRCAREYHDACAGRSCACKCGHKNAGNASKRWAEITEEHKKARAAKTKASTKKAVAATRGSSSPKAVKRAK